MTAAYLRWQVPSESMTALSWHWVHVRPCLDSTSAHLRQ